MAGRAEKPRDGETQVHRGMEARQAPDPASMTAEQYLERYSVTAYMKDLLTVLLENRPEEPLDFIADYFNCAVNGVPTMMRSYRYIKLTKRNRLAFMDNLAQAYTIMCRSSENPGVGLTGLNYLRLLHMVCSDFPPEVVHALMQVLNKKETDSISFPVFVAGINICLLYEEFIEHAEKLFNACEACKHIYVCCTKKRFNHVMVTDIYLNRTNRQDGSGMVEHEIFMAVIRQINSQPHDAEHAEGWVVPGKILMDKVAAVLAESDRVNGKVMITFRDFVSTLIRIFVKQGEVR